jgi:hypothetical protein
MQLLHAIRTLRFGSIPYFCHPRGRLLVEVLLELALVVADIAGGLLLAVAGDGADDSVLLADDTVGGALDVALACAALYSASPAACSSLPELDQLVAPVALPIWRGRNEEISMRGIRARKDPGKMNIRSRRWYP